MIDVQQKKDKIVSFLRIGGPSIPVRIARTIEMEPVFTSAILSELLNDKKIKASHMRIGASPFYFLSGQEQRLEEHVDNLKSVERDAFSKLKEMRILFDDDEEPAIRVALRNLKDFAVVFKLNDKIVWRYAFASDDEVNGILKGSKDEVKKIKEVKKENVKPTMELKKEKPRERMKEAKKEGINKEVAPIFESEDEEKKSEFFLEVEAFLSRKSARIVEEIQIEKKEITLKVEIQTNFGKMEFLLIAKNKKTVTKDEISSILQRVRYHSLPCICLIRVEPKKSILKFIEGNGLIRIEVLE